MSDISYKTGMVKYHVAAQSANIFERQDSSPTKVDGYSSLTISSHACLFCMMVSDTETNECPYCGGNKLAKGIL